MLRALLLFFLAASLRAQLLVDTFAGGKIPSGVPAQTVLLQSIAGIVWDPAGNLVFCDSVDNVIRRVRTDGVIETIAGTGVTGYGGDGDAALNALLNSPSSPAYDSSGNLYFLDTMNYRIRRIDAKGVITTVAGDGIPFVSGMDTHGPATLISLGYAGSLAVDSGGNVYFSEPNQNRIRRVTTSGMVDVYAGTGGFGSAGDGGPATAASLDNPASLAVDNSGSLFFVDGFTRIRRVANTGVVTTFVVSAMSAEIKGFASIATDSAGNVYASLGNEVVRYAPDGTGVVIAGGLYGPNSSPDGPALPSVIAPVSVTVDADRNIGFVEQHEGSFNSITYTLREITAQSMLKTLAGANRQPSPDGTPLHDAWFLAPSSIAFDQSGNLYVAESQACVIRKIDTKGTLTTFAGTGVCGTSAPSGNARNANLIYPVSIAVDSLSRVWVVDDAWNLYSIAQDGTISAFTSVPPLTSQLAIDAKDRFYIRVGSSIVDRILPDKSRQTIYTQVFGSEAVNGIGTDLVGNVYFDTSVVYRVNHDATYTQVAQAQSGFGSSGFAVDGAGTIWQGSQGAIGITSAAGATVLGNYIPGFAGDRGFAQDAIYSIPTSAGGAMTFAPTGDLFFIDSNRIRKITGSGPASAPSISSNGIVNAASYTGGGVSPGELVSIFGTNFGPGDLLINLPLNNSFPLALGRTKVLFNGIPGAITAATANQINVLVPSSLASTAGSDGSGPVNVTVQVDDSASAPLVVPLVASAPGLWTTDASGSGQGAILNQDGSMNSSSNPAVRGSIISLFGTGDGLESPQLPIGSLVLSTPFPAPANTVTAMVGGQPADVLYAGATPQLVSGVFQINVRIPESAPAGNVPVSVSIGSSGTTRQVTLSVR